MPDVTNLQRFIMWKFETNTVKELIQILIKLFGEWSKYNAEEGSEYIYCLKEIKQYLFK
jgi:hypothetical protein